MKKISLYILCISIMLSGCSKTPSISSIKSEKKEDFKNNFNISSDDSYGKFKAYINDDNQVTRLCYISSEDDINNKRCEHVKESDEETFYINKNSYFYDSLASGVEASCGFGMRKLINTRLKGTEDICSSRFTKTNGIYFIPRLIAGVAIYGIGVSLLGTLHSVVFDEDNFRNAIAESNINAFKNELFMATYNDDNSVSLDVIYLDIGDTKDSLEKKYDYLLERKLYNNGIVFLEKDTNRLISIVKFEEFKNYNTVESISLQIEKIITDTATNNKISLNYKDFTSKIPKEENIPILPKVPYLVKDEFETKENFNKRVRNAVEDRETKIRDLQKQYSHDVLQRNVYIDNLQEAYKIYLQQSSEDKYALLEEIQENIPMLTKVLFLENISGYSAKDFQYNADKEELYFNIYSKEGDFSQEVVANVPASSAKTIKRKKKFEIVPNIKAAGNTIKLLGFKIKDTINDDSFEVSYTNVNFIPEEVRVRIINQKENIDEEASKYFKKYKQDDIAIVDTSKKEIWYIDIANSINARVPKWFSNPLTDKTIGYGEGNSLREAKAHAISDLAFSVKVKVNSVYEEKSITNNFKSFNEVKEQTKQNTDIELSSSDYKLFKQDNIDGRWYVGLMLDRL